VTNRGSPIA